ncbi:hypothetical protein ACQ4PT_060052 [Festuca glaucescens]
MPPRTKRTKNIAAGTSTRAEKKKISGWERSKFTSADQRKLKKVGLLRNDAAMKIPDDEAIPNPPDGYRVIFADFLTRGLSVPVHEFLRGLLFVYGIQLYQLTPNSILHISIFITHCECFLGVHPHWGLWKCIFYLRRNNSRNAIYNEGGVCICVRPEAGYFDMKFADSVQGWRKKWLYVKDEPTGSQQYGLAPFDMSQEILRRKSWDAEATPEESVATESLIARIKALQNTQGQELSGVQIIAHFLQIHVQPIQARASPLWLYSGAGDAARISEDLSVKELEKLVRRFTSLNKKTEVPSACRVEPFSGAHALPTNHQILSSLPPAPEGGDVPERAIITDDSQEASVRDSEPAESEKSAGSSDKISESGHASDSSYTNSVPPAASPEKRKRKRTDDEEDSGASKLSEPAVEESSHEEPADFDPFASAAAISSDDEEHPELDASEPASTSTSHTLVISEDPKTALETTNLPPSPRVLKKKLRTGAAGKGVVATGSLSTPLLDDPLMKEMVNIGALHLAEKRAKELEKKLEASEKAREEAKAKAASVEDLRDRLNAAETALREKDEQISKREAAIIARLDTQSVRFSKKIGEMYTRNQDSEEDALLDTLSILEMNCTLARDCLWAGRIALERIFPHFFPKAALLDKFELLAKSFNDKGDPVLAHRQASLKIGVEGTIALVIASGEKIDWAKVAAIRVFDNYTETGCFDASPAAPQPAKIPENISSDASSVPDSMKREMEELRQQLQLLKKQTMTALEQARKSSDREQTALLQAQESLKSEKAATAKAIRSAERENYMLDLMTDASQDMAGSFLDTAAEEQRDDEEHPELDASEPTPTSTSHTLVISEDPKVAPESSDPPRSPRALKKKPRTGAAGKGVAATGSLSTPLLNDPVMKEMVDIGSRFIGFRDEADSLRRALHLAEKHSKELEKKLEASEKAREEAERKATSVEDLRDRLNAAETALKKIGEMYTRNQDLEEDALLDTLSVLEMNCTLARDCLKVGRTALERIFPHFFPKDALPDRFEPLAKSFTGKGDPVLAHHQGSLKIGVEGTIALVIASGEKIDWAKVAAVRGLNKDRWTALIKSAKAYSKKIIAILDPAASSSASTAQTEVK